MQMAIEFLCTLESRTPSEIIKHHPPKPSFSKNQKTLVINRNKTNKKKTLFFVFLFQKKPTNRFFSAPRGVLSRRVFLAELQTASGDPAACEANSSTTCSWRSGSSGMAEVHVFLVLKGVLLSRQATPNSVESTQRRAFFVANNRSLRESPRKIGDTQLKHSVSRWLERAQPQRSEGLRSGPLHQNPVGPLVQDLCMRISCPRSLCHDVCIRIL